MIPKGFLYSTAEAAIKKPGRKDLALIYSRVEATMAGMFTSNKVKAAPVKMDLQKIKSGKGQAIVINSGNANACTGIQGFKDAEETAKHIARGLNIKSSHVYVCSTGVIGTAMPMQRIRPKMKDLLHDLGHATIGDVAEAIMTTDTFPKVVRKKMSVDGKAGSIIGICKGAGMICPHMATMLCFIMTDMAVHPRALDQALKEAVSRSFNRITIDGDMSTNDTVLIMANGMLGNRLITEKSDAYSVFKKSLGDTAYELSKLIAQDGEGATKLVEIEVKDARNETDAEKAAFAVANSNLVKTAIYGNDANWGRIMAALGYSGAALREDRVDISFGAVRVVKNGLTTGRDNEAGKILKGNHIRIRINLHMGTASAKVLTCDMSEEYIRVNAAYRT